MTPGQADAVLRIKNAVTTVDLAKRRDGCDEALGYDELGLAVQAARDVGVSWQVIGDVLGIRRGAAYQRYRRRPSH